MNRIYKLLTYSVAIVSLVVCSTLTTFADTPEEKALKSRHSDLIKQIKKKYKVKHVTPKEASDGTLWFDVDDGYFHGFVDHDGNALTPLDKHISVWYLPPVNKGVTEIPNMDSNSAGVLVENGKFPFHHPTVPAGILGINASTAYFYDLAGVMLMSIEYTGDFRFLPGYVHFGNAPESHQGFAIGNSLRLYSLFRPSKFVRADGKLVSEFESMNIDSDGYCYISNKIDGVAKQGVIRLDDETFNIPVAFHCAFFEKNQWRVIKNLGEESQPYDFNADYSISYRDNGEKYYNQKKWDEVIHFYENEGIQAPWAQFFTGMALYNKAYDQGSLPAFSFITNVEKEDFEKLKLHNFKEAMSIESAIDMMNLAKAMFENYSIVGDDEEYKKKAAIMIRAVDDELSYLQQYAIAYPKAVRKLEAHNAQVAAQMQAQQEQQAQMWSAVLGIFSNAMQSIASGGGSSNRVSTSSAIVNTSSSSGGMSSSSSSTDNAGRKGWLKGEIATWKNKLKKAESARSQAFDNYSANPTREAKRALDSKENTVNECLNMIRQYESELNSLK